MEYRKGLIDRYGTEYVEWLEGDHPLTNYTIEDYNDIWREYQDKCKALCRE